MLVKAINAAHPRPAPAAVAAAVALVLLAGSVMASAGGDPPLFKTPLWRQRGSLLLRREAAGGGALLLKHSARGAVYRYSPAGRSLTPATAKEWGEAAGEVADCDRQFHPSPLVLDLDSKTRRLSARGREVRTAGRVVLDMRASPGERLVAVVSAEGRGPGAGSVFPTLGGGGGAGRHYHQLFTLPDVKAVGGPSRLPPVGEREPVTPCWSADGGFVVYTDTLFFSLTVVETNVTL